MPPKTRMTAEEVAADLEAKGIQVDNRTREERRQSYRRIRESRRKTTARWLNKVMRGEEPE